MASPSLASVLNLFDKITIKGRLTLPTYTDENHLVLYPKIDKSFRKIIHKTDKDKSLFISGIVNSFSPGFDTSPNGSAIFYVLLKYIEDLVINYNASLTISGENIPFNNDGKLNPENIRSILKKYSNDFNLNEIDSSEWNVTFKEQGQMKINIAGPPESYVRWDPLVNN